MIKRLLLAVVLGFTPALFSLSLAVPASADEVAVASHAQPVNINTADAETLAKNLVGVGLTRARAIVRYRDDFGPFFSADDLTEVKGVGNSIVDKNRDRITLE